MDFKELLPDGTDIDILKYYPAEPQLRGLLLTHSECVARKALETALRHPELSPDLKFIAEAALLHDIGIVACDAPGIYCHGSLPYICHGIEGARMLAEDGLLRHARVCERHTGSGLTAEEIEDEALPLPPRDMLPETIEEKIICYADKFYSKNPDSLIKEKDMEHILKGFHKLGDAPLQRFIALHNMLG